MVFLKPAAMHLLVDAGRLRQHLHDPDWILLDCRHDLFDGPRGARVYAESHVPGASLVPVETALSGTKTGTNGRHPSPSAADFAAFLNQHGVTPATQLVAYDDAGGQYAARLWWLARWIGLSRVAVLDGGWNKWLADGQPVTTVVPTLRGGGTIVPKPDSAPVCTSADVLAGLQAGESHVLDARTAERFRGENEPIDPVAGRIPTARNRFFKLNLNADLTMRPAAELKREFEDLLAGWHPAQVIHQCGSGVTACANLLAMEYAGLPGSRLYPGSWSEWIAAPTRPVARG